MYSYSFLKKETEVDDGETKSTAQHSRWRWPAFVLFAVISWTATGTIGFLIGNSRTACTIVGIDETLHLKSNTVVFEHNETFSSEPSPSTNRAWEDIFPKSHGFMKHPTLAPELSLLAVYHQLHCLDGIRHGYHTVLKGLTEDPFPTDLKELAKPHHLLHCFDYLRQALMCHADTNVEPVVPEFAGARGFGVAHRCRDYEQVNEWVQQWGVS